MTYDPFPCYPVAGGKVESGSDALAEELARNRPAVVALDGPAALPWERVVGRQQEALVTAGVSCQAVDIRGFLAGWDEVRRWTAGAELPGDPVFARPADGSLADVFEDLPRRVARPDAEVTLAFGPGTALVAHERLWYLDVPKRLTLQAMQRGQPGNLGQPPGQPGAEQRHLFVDWPLLDRHRDTLVTRVDRFGRERQVAVPKHGRDLVVGEGAWLSSFVIVVGPCSIGEHVVVGVGSLVLHDVVPRTVVAGSPATPCRVIPHSEGTGT